MTTHVTKTEESLNCPKKVIQIKPGKNLKHIYDVVKKKVDLSTFLETEISCNLRWYELNISAGTECPMPHHKDSKPSFRIKFMREESMWVFHCLGCGAKGTIVDFCRDYYGFNNSFESLVYICKKFEFDKDPDLLIPQLKDITKKANLHKKMEYEHIIASNQCRMLLSKNYEKHNRWVSSTYKRMNKALDEYDLGIIETINDEIFRKMQEK